MISRGLGRTARNQTQSSKQWPLTTFLFLPLAFSKAVLAVIYSFCIFITEPFPWRKILVYYTDSAIGLFIHGMLGIYPKAKEKKIGREGNDMMRMET